MWKKHRWFSSYNILTSSVICYWKCTRQHAIYLLNRQRNRTLARSPKHSINTYLKRIFLITNQKPWRSGWGRYLISTGKMHLFYIIQERINTTLLRSQPKSINTEDTLRKTSGANMSKPKETKIPYLRRQETPHLRQVRGVFFRTVALGLGVRFDLPCKVEWWMNGPVISLYRTGMTHFPSSDPHLETAYKQRQKRLLLLYAQIVKYTNTWTS